MSWVTVRPEQIEAGDLVMWEKARTVESVAGNERSIVLTFEDGEPVTLSRAGASLVWRHEA